MDVTSGNAVEFIVCILAIVHCELQIAQSLLMGSILANLLLVIGLDYCAGAVAHQDLRVTRAAQRAAEHLIPFAGIFAIFSVGFYGHVYSDNDPITNGAEGSRILLLSRAEAVLLLVFYIAVDFRIEDGNFDSATSHLAVGELTHPGRKSLDPDAKREGNRDLESGYDSENCEAKVSTSVATCTSLLAIVIVIVTAEFLMENIRGVTDEPLLPRKEWVGLVLLPVVMKVPEFLQMITSNDKRIRCCEVVVGSSLQIVMFIIPLLIVIAWILGKPLLMFFDPFESVAMLAIAILINYAFRDPGHVQELYYVEIYAVIALLFWFHPGSVVQTVLAHCK